MLVRVALAARAVHERRDGSRTRPRRGAPCLMPPPLPPRPPYTVTEWQRWAQESARFAADYGQLSALAKACADLKPPAAPKVKATKRRSVKKP